MTDPELRDFFHALMQEAFAVGKAIGVALDSDFVDERMSFVAITWSQAGKLRWHTISNTADGWSLIGLLARCVRSDARWVSQRWRTMPVTSCSNYIG